MTPDTVRFKATCAYDGTDFLGWQSQAKGVTIQDTIEGALASIVGQPVRIHGSGRTDTGVHAKGQVFHYDLHWVHGPDALKRALSTQLPVSIQIRQLELVSDAFHARYTAIGKRYVYRLYGGYAHPFDTRYCWSLGPMRLDIDSMRSAASHLIGVHDFSAFAALRPAGSPEDPVKDLRQLEIEPQGDFLIITTEASGYLYKMVRSLVGALVEVGRGKLSAKAIPSILASGVRPPVVITAPAQGLCLDRVYY